MPRPPSPRSRTNAAGKSTRLPSHAGSSRPGECAKRTSATVPGTSGHQAWTALSARSRSSARSPKRLNASAAGESRSAQSRWWSKLWCGSTNDVRARAALSAPSVTKLAPVSRAHSRERRLPAGRASPAGRGREGLRADRVPARLAPRAPAAGAGVAETPSARAVSRRGRPAPSSAPPRALPASELQSRAARNARTRSVRSFVAFSS